jgi:hypothetical protein
MEASIGGGWGKWGPGSSLRRRSGTMGGREGSKSDSRPGVAHRRSGVVGRGEAAQLLKNPDRGSPRARLLSASPPSLPPSSALPSISRNRGPIYHVPLPNSLSPPPPPPRHLVRVLPAPALPAALPHSPRHAGPRAPRRVPVERQQDVHRVDGPGPVRERRERDPARCGPAAVAGLRVRRRVRVAAEALDSLRDPAAHAHGRDPPADLQVVAAREQP